MTNKKVKPDAPEVAAATPAQGTWCTIHETNAHDLKIYRTILDLAENCKRRFAECIAAGTIGNYYSCGQLGHMSCDYPGRVAVESARVAREEVMQEPREDVACGRGNRSR
jgi:hypothetical protein